MTIKPNLFNGEKVVAKSFTKEQCRQGLISIIEKTTGIKKDRFIFFEQVHGTKVAVLRKKDSLPKDGCFPKTDGVICDKKGVLLIVRHADCVPVFLYDPKKEVIGLVHSGWRGTVGKIGLVAILKMIEEFTCQIKDILVYLGPAAQICCYQNQNPIFLDLWEWKRFVKKRKSKVYIDLTGFIREMFIKTGLEKDNLKVSKICTVCDKRFFSWTRQRKEGRRMKNGMSIIGITNY